MASRCKYTLKTQDQIKAECDKLLFVFTGSNNLCWMNQCKACGWVGTGDLYLCDICKHTFCWKHTLAKTRKLCLKCLRSK